VERAWGSLWFIGEDGESLSKAPAFWPWWFSTRDGNAETLVESELYAEGDKKGIVMASFEARKRLRYTKPAEENEECPDGKLLKPSFMMDLSVFRHIAAVTRFRTSPRAYCEALTRSGSQRESRSGYVKVNSYDRYRGVRAHILVVCQTDSSSHP
jgi:hypothetical protein